MNHSLQQISNFVGTMVRSVVIGNSLGSESSEMEKMPFNLSRQNSEQDLSLKSMFLFFFSICLKPTDQSPSHYKVRDQLNAH